MPSREKFGIISENKMSELELSKNVNSESCSPKLIINNENQSKNNSNDFIKENCL